LYIIIIISPCSESGIELHRPSDRRLSAKLLPTFADSGVSRNQRRRIPYGRNLDSLDIIIIIIIIMALQLIVLSWPLF
jgi:hypothetical protein